MPGFSKTRILFDVETKVHLDGFLIDSLTNEPMNNFTSTLYKDGARLSYKINDHSLAELMYNKNEERKIDYESPKNPAFTQKDNLADDPTFQKAFDELLLDQFALDSEKTSNNIKESILKKLKNYIQAMALLPGSAVRTRISNFIKNELHTDALFIGGADTIENDDNAESSKIITSSNIIRRENEFFVVVRYPLLKAFCITASTLPFNLIDENIGELQVTYKLTDTGYTLENVTISANTYDQLTFLEKFLQEKNTANAENVNAAHILETLKTNAKEAIINNFIPIYNADYTNTPNSIVDHFKSQEDPPNVDLIIAALNKIVDTPGLSPKKFYQFEYIAALLDAITKTEPAKLPRVAPIVEDLINNAIKILKQTGAANKKFNLYQSFFFLEIITKFNFKRLNEVTSIIRLFSSDRTKIKDPTQLNQLDKIEAWQKLAQFTISDIKNKASMKPILKTLTPVDLALAFLNQVVRTNESNQMLNEILSPESFVGKRLLTQLQEAMPNDEKKQQLITMLTQIPASQRNVLTSLNQPTWEKLLADTQLQVHPESSQNKKPLMTKTNLASINGLVDKIYTLLETPQPADSLPESPKTNLGNLTIESTTDNEGNPLFTVGTLKNAIRDALAQTESPSSDNDKKIQQFINSLNDELNEPEKETESEEKPADKPKISINDHTLLTFKDGSFQLAAYIVNQKELAADRSTITNSFNRFYITHTKENIKQKGRLFKKRNTPETSQEEFKLRGFGFNKETFHGLFPIADDSPIKPVIQNCTAFYDTDKQSTAPTDMTAHNYSPQNHQNYDKINRYEITLTDGSILKHTIGKNSADEYVLSREEGVTPESIDNALKVMIAGGNSKVDLSKLETESTAPFAEIKLGNETIQLTLQEYVYLKAKIFKLEPTETTIDTNKMTDIIARLQEKISETPILKIPPTPIQKHVVANNYGPQSWRESVNNRDNIKPRIPLQSG